MKKIFSKTWRFMNADKSIEIGLVVKCFRFAGSRAGFRDLSGSVPKPDCRENRKNSQVSKSLCGRKTRIKKRLQATLEQLATKSRLSSISRPGRAVL